ncbi:ECF transporter S component [Gemella cuniculi]|uniref:ECF transporter S component n=1 Tax=Gemella cuniculi TaxID=150240 RepID=UPI00040F7DEB|nr:ECF transporter S component [Gemella cuniculi]
MYKKNIHSLVLSGMLSVIALLLSFFSFAVPFLPPFLKFDFTFIPLFMALLIMNYKNALLVSILKNFLHFVLISHEPTGTIANIVVEFIFISIIVLFYKKSPIKIILGGIIATVTMTIFMSLLNYFVLLPAYGYIMNLSDIVQNIKTIISVGIIPFNLIKGTLVTFLFFVTLKIYKGIPASIKLRFS